MKPRFHLNQGDMTLRLPEGLVAGAFLAEILIVVFYLGKLLVGVMMADFEIVYIVTGDRPTVDITVQTPNGSEQHRRHPLPFKVTYEFDRSEYISVRASIPFGDGAGTVTCTVVENGKVVRQATSSGASVIAMCDGWAGKGKAVPGAKISPVSTPAQP